MTQPPAGTSVTALVQHYADQLTAAGVSFGHGTTNAHDEAAWLVLWALGLPLDSELDTLSHVIPAPVDIAKLATLFEARIQQRTPAAYLTRQAWLCGVPFYVDERAIVPRSLIAELILPPGGHSALDTWLREDTRRVLDLCTGNGSLAVLAALAFPDITVDAADISPDALAVARINVDQHQLQDRVRLLPSDGLAALTGERYDLILCNPPYVNRDSMAALPAEYQAEPALALAGGIDGMDFVRHLLSKAHEHLTPHGVLVLEIGHERAHFEAAFPTLEAVWLDTSAGGDQVLLLTAAQLPPSPSLCAPASTFTP